MTSYFDLFRNSVAQLSKVGCETPDLDARILLCHVFNISMAELLRDFRDPVPNSNGVEGFERMLSDRKSGKPLAYIVQGTDFRGREYAVKEGVFIPRPETEILVEKTIEAINDRGLSNQDFQILELGFGTGVIGIELALAFPKARVVGWDVSPKAFDVASENLKRHNVKSVELIRKDCFQDWESVTSHLESSMPSVFVSNPPYLSEGDMETLDSGVRDYEPRQALQGGADGMLYYQRLFTLLQGYSVLLVVELGIGQFKILKDMLEKIGIVDYKVFPDYQGIDRVLIVPFPG